MTATELMEQTTSKATAAATILQRSVMLTLHRHYFGNTRKVDMDDVVEMAGGDADASTLEQLTATKKLIDQKELRSAMRVLGKAQRFLRKLSIPTHRVFGERSYLLPIAHVEEADRGLSELQAELLAEAASLAARYQDAVDRQRERLGRLFKEADYMPAHEVARAFGLDWSYVSFAAPDRLETVSSVLAKKANAKYQEKLADAFAEVRQTMRGTALAVARELVNKLGADKTGKPKGVRGTALDDLSEFVARYRAMNLTDDAELDAVVADLRQIVAGTSVGDLRDYDAARDRVVAQAAAAVEKLEVLTTRRGISFGEL